MVAMNVSLTPELERFVREQVGSGRYLSSSELVREALRLLQDRERYRELKLAELKTEIQRGLESGPAALLDLAGVRARARARLESERNAGPE